MILRSQRNISSEGLSVNRLYPVIAYEVEAKNGESKFQIVDDCRSLSWKQIEAFQVISGAVDNYMKVIDNKTVKKYMYKNLTNTDFETDYYSENEKSVIAGKQLEKALISIFSNELSVKELLYNLDTIGYNDDNADLLLKSFFCKANSKDIIIFVNAIYNKILEMSSSIIKIIVEELSNYQEIEINNLFMELYINASFISNKTQEKITQYLKI